MMIEVKQLPERRRQDRFSLARPVKVYDPRGCKYIPGTTSNVSPGGALIVIQHPLLVDVGDVVYLGIALKRREPIVLTNEMIEARVVRRLEGEDGRTTLAIRFAVPAVAEETTFTELRRAA